ncbi:GNAT family N-acetyltransferase [Sulfurimonas sp. NW15]|uniref:GNAT family N-acyltransferase n=1 Tax=Sulfurimonas sp. NW15 TaxID=2922729 RepID=UPI003DA7C4B8
MNFTFLEVSDQKNLDKIFAFRYKILREIYPEYLEKSALKDEKEYDKYDAYSVHFAALDEEENVCATVRLIYNSPIGYPTQNSARFDNSMFEKNKLGEMSRIFVDKKYRSMKTTKVIIEAVKHYMYGKMLEEGIEYTYGNLEKNFLRLLKIYKMPYKPVGKLQQHQDFGWRYPCILYTKELGCANPELVKLWGTME